MTTIFKMKDLDKLGSIGSAINDMINLVTSHGIFKLFLAILMLCVCIMMVKFSINFDPDNYIRTIKDIEISIEDASREKRAQADVFIREELKQLTESLSASRTSVLEFHNGKTNSSGLGFYYVDMSYEIVDNHSKFISEQYQNISLSWLELDDILYKDGYWYGTTEELKKVDPMLGTKIETNGTKWIGLYLLEFANDDHFTIPLGILEVSFNEVPTLEKQIEVGRSIRKTGAHIVSKLKY